MRKITICIQGGGNEKDIVTGMISEIFKALGTVVPEGFSVKVENMEAHPGAVEIQLPEFMTKRTEREFLWRKGGAN